MYFNNWRWRARQHSKQAAEIAPSGGSPEGEGMSTQHQLDVASRPVSPSVISSHQFFSYCIGDR